MTLGCKILSWGKKRLNGSLKSPGVGLRQASQILSSANSQGATLCCSSSSWSGVISGSTLQQRWRHCFNLFVLSNPAPKVSESLSQKLFVRAHCISLLAIWPFTTFGQSQYLGGVCWRSQGWVTSWSDPWCGERQCECPRAPGSRNECAGGSPDHSYRR